MSRLLFRAWVCWTVLMGLAVAVIGLPPRGGPVEWLQAMSLLSGVPFAVGYGLLWVFRGAGQRKA
jgi:hypothetical protein